MLSFYRSYHGNTGSAIVATGDPHRVPNEFADAHVHFFGPYAYRSSFWAVDEAQESERALLHLEQTIVFEGPEDYHDRLDDPSLEIDEHCMLFIRGTGPIGYPGGAEVVNMQPLWRPADRRAHPAIPRPGRQWRQLRGGLEGP